jgi:hypothetical protein
MRELVGVTHLGKITASLKQEALIFTRIGICSADYDLKNPGQFKIKNDRYLLGEVEWLLDQGIAFDIPSLKTAVPDDEYGTLVNDLKTRQLEQLDQARARVNSVSEISNWEETFDEAEEIIIETKDLLARVRCIQLRNLEGIDAFPLFFGEKLLSQTQGVTRADVVNLVIAALPRPDDNTPWEQIVEYRSDPDTVGKFLALRLWITEMAKAQLPPREVEERLEWLLHDYQRHLNLHRLKYTMGNLEAILTMGADVLENIVKINWSRAAKGLFELKRRRIELMEAEMKTPGAEVAYIVRSREQFGR